MSPIVRTELYETVAHTVSEEKGLTVIDFDVFSTIIIESWKRQVDINCEVFDLVFHKFCDNQVERDRRDSMMGSMEEEIKGEMRPPSPTRQGNQNMTVCCFFVYFASARNLTLCVVLIFCSNFLSTKVNKTATEMKQAILPTVLVLHLVD